MSERKVAVVTGGNRGLGFETCRQLAQAGYEVVLTSRNAANAQAAAEQLHEAGLPVRPAQCEVSDPASVRALAAWMHEVGRLDALVNNAGIMIDSEVNPNGMATTSNVPWEVVERTLRTNLGGAYLLSQALIPLLTASGGGNIVHVSSGMGQLSDMGAGYPAYRISKTALNALTVIQAAELIGSGIRVNAVCPGWVRTDMGGPNAARSLDQGARGIVWAATLPAEGPTGGFFRDGERLDW